MKLIVFVGLFYFFCLPLFSQSNNDQARAYFLQAKSSFESNNYNKTIDYLTTAEELLGNTNPVILNLKVKTYYNLKQYDKAKESLAQFSEVSANADAELVDETLIYLVKINDAIKEEAAIKEREHLAELKRQEEARLAELERQRKIEEKRKKTAEAVKHFEYENSGSNKKLKYTGSVYLSSSEIDEIVANNRDVIIANIKEKEQQARAEYFKNYMLKYPKSDDLIPFEKDKKWGFINSSGEFVIQPKYVRVSYFSQGLAVVADKIFYGYINKSGKIVIDYQFLTASVFSNGVATVCDYVHKCGVINIKGEKFIQFEYDEIRAFREGLAAVKKKNDWGYINMQGELVIPAKYRSANDFKNGKAEVLKGSKFIYIDKLGRKLN